MRKLIAIILFAVSCALASAQTENAVQQVKDSTALNQAASVIMDSTLVGKTIFDVLPSGRNGSKGNVTVNQNREIQQALLGKIRENTFKETTGYRVRIYFSNAQNAREESTAAVARFTETYGDYPVYHSYVNPNFKVTVGDFPTKSEALELLSLVKRDFPSAFIVKETITLRY